MNTKSDPFQKKIKETFIHVYTKQIISPAAYFQQNQHIRQN